MTRIAVALMACSLAFAQAAPRQNTSPPSFVEVAAAVAQQSYSVVEQRRFRDAEGNVVSVRERLDVAANGSESPNYDLTFLGVCGEPPRSPLNLQWQQTYQRYGRLFVEHGSFHVSDLAKIQQNYTLHHFGTVTRAGRVAFREVVFPVANDKSTWLVDIDAITSIPLYQAEFDSQFRMLAEVEAETFTAGVPGPLPGSSTTGIGATGSMAVSHPDFAAARTHLGDPPGLVDPGTNIVAGYVLDRIVTRDDPLNGQQKLVAIYSDGLDRFMVVQTPNTPDVFAGLSGAKGGAVGNTIGRYRDPALSVLVFWDQDVLFHVAGRGGMQRLDEVAKQVYLQALSTH